MVVAALYVETNGVYFGLDNVDPWDVTRDARTYTGPHRVVAHPPCQLWGSFAYVNYARWGGEHNRPGNDGGCFQSALASVRRWGGVLEHPAFSRAWKAFALPSPLRIGWQSTQIANEWVCEVWQVSVWPSGSKTNVAVLCIRIPPDGASLGSTRGHTSDRFPWPARQGPEQTDDLEEARKRYTDFIPRRAAVAGEQLRIQQVTTWQPTSSTA
jgi:hypothetical protein